MKPEMIEASSASGLAASVADEIRAEILRRSLKPGEFVATQADLAARFDVSRNAVREGVERLRGLGLVDSRRCKGVIVAEADPARTFGLVLPQYAIERAAFSEVVRLRYSIEVGSVEMAVRGATDAHIKHMKELCDEIKTLGGQPRKRPIEIDSEFHATILSATGSGLIQDMHGVLGAFFDRAAQLLPGLFPEQEAELMWWEHASIAEAFAARDSERARVLLKAHLIQYLDFDEAEWGERAKAIRAKGSGVRWEKGKTKG